MPTVAWILYGIFVAVLGFYTLGRELTSREWKVVAAVLFVGLGVAAYSGYSDYSDRVETKALHNQVNELQQIQAYNTGQLSTLGQMSAETLNMVATKAGTSPNTGVDAVASAAVSKIDELSKQVASLEAHVTTPVISPQSEAQIIDALKSAGPQPMSVTALAANNNAVDYGDQWVKILKAGGWLKPNDRPSFFLPIGEAPVGLSFKIKGPHIPKGLDIFGDILKHNGVRFSSSVATDVHINDENTFVLVVGGNP